MKNINIDKNCSYNFQINKDLSVYLTSKLVVKLRIILEQVFIMIL